MKKSRNATLAVLAGVISLCGFQYSSTMLPQDLRLHRYKAVFNKVHHPENTMLVGNYNFLGALDTQRVMYKETYPQGCDYIVGEVREYSGVQERIKAFYAMQTLLVDGEDKKINVKFISVDQNGHIDPYGWGMHGPNEDRLLQRLLSSPFITLDPAKSLYFVSVSKFETPTSDIRCLF